MPGTLQDGTHTKVNKAKHSMWDFFAFMEAGQVGKSRDFLEPVLELNPIDQAVYSRGNHMYKDI